jgi:hypothetical protein
MKCKLKKEMEIHEPHAPQELIAQCVRRGKFLFAPAGTIIGDPQCWRLVLMAVADPEDEECAAKTQRTPEQVAAAEKAAKRLERRIDPEDFAAFDAGEIIGYNADGSKIPGPNAKPATPHLDEEAEELAANP